MINGQHFNHINRKKINGPSAAVLRYDGENGQPPSVVARGTGQLAKKIMDIAKENDIYIQKDSTLLANLLDIELGDGVPPQLYAVIAEIFLLLEKMERSY